MQANIAIVIVAYNRSHSLHRLLNSLANANYSGYADIPLVISIDYSGNEHCGKLADDFHWPYGLKTVIKHIENLGLKRHIIKCGDLTSLYDAIILLEDDLYVSAAFYDYAQQAYQFYNDEEHVAGIALYNYKFNETALCPFEPLTDGYDNYFMQVPCSSGQVWTRKHWEGFSKFLVDYEKVEIALPTNVMNWSDRTSWKKLYFKYIIHSDKYFVYPRISLSTNFGDIGQHFSSRVSVWQSSILIGKKQFRFSQINQSFSIYDSYFELAATIYNKIYSSSTSVSFDLNGSKSLEMISTEFLISSKVCQRPLKKYCISLYPYENNILLGIESEDENSFISFGRTKDFLSVNRYNRIILDVSRTFFNTELLYQQGREDIYQSNEYRIGRLISYPFRKFKSILRRIKA